MKILAAIPRALWKLLFVANFIVGFFVLYPFFFVLLLREQWFPLAYKLKRFWAAWILFTPGIRVLVKSEVDLQKLPSPAIYCANHVSYLDIVLSYFLVPSYFVFMAKQELDRLPLFRIFFKRMNILVDRKSKMGSYKAFMQAGEKIDKGHSVFLFPEGSISKEAPALRPFKNGCFKLAIDKQIPIIPITFLNNWKILQNGGFFKSNGKPGIARVIIHQPIETKNLGEADLLTLKGNVYDIISNDMKNES